MTDPRTPNAKAFHVDANGKIDGVNLVYEERPQTKYRLIYATLVGEVAAQGNTVATFRVLNADGIEINEPVFLAWPYPDLSNKALPGNQQRQHMIPNGYDAAGGVTGPLALFVGDANWGVCSDVVGGVGLPNNRHVCFDFVWQERGAVVPDPEPEPVNEFEEHMIEQVADALAQLEAMHALLASMGAVLSKLAAHLGA